MSNSVLSSNFKLIKLILLIYLFFQYNLNSQNNNFDSLLVELKKVKNDSLKCKILFELITRIEDDAVWPAYNNQLYTISKNKVETGNDKSGFYHLMLIESSNNKGFLFDRKGKIDSSLIFYKECLILSEKTNNNLSTIEALYNIGKSTNKLGNTAKALEYLTKSLVLAEKSNSNEQAARILISLGLTLQKQGDLEKAMSYFQKASHIQKEIKDIRGLAYCLSSIAGVYLEQKDYTKSLNYFMESIKIFKEIGDDMAYFNNKRNLAKIYIVNKNFQEAIIICKEIINDPKITIYQHVVSRSYDMLGLAYFETNQLSEGLKNTLISLKIAKELNDIELIRNSNRQLAFVYKRLGKNDLALESYETYIQLRDSMSNTETRKASIKSQLKYEYEKKAAADSVKVAEERKISQLKLKQEKTQKQYLYLGLFAITLFGIFMFNRFIVTKKQKNIIEQQKVIVEQQKALVDQKQKEILESIHYAKRIQNATFPSEYMITKTLNKLKN